MTTQKFNQPSAASPTSTNPASFQAPELEVAGEEPDSQLMMGPEENLSSKPLNTEVAADLEFMAVADFYDLLGVKHGVSKTRVEAAYQKRYDELTRIRSGQNLMRANLAGVILDRLDIARDTLINTKLRAEYENLQAMEMVSALQLSNEYARTPGEFVRLAQVHWDSAKKLLRSRDLENWFRYRLRKEDIAIKVLRLSQNIQDSDSALNRALWTIIDTESELRQNFRKPLVFENGKSVSSYKKFLKVCDERWSTAVRYLENGDIEMWLRTKDENMANQARQFMSTPITPGATINPNVALEKLLHVIEGSLPHPVPVVSYSGQAPQPEVFLGAFDRRQAPYVFNFTITKDEASRGYLYGDVSVSSPYFKLDWSNFEGGLQCTLTVDAKKLPFGSSYNTNLTVTCPAGVFTTTLIFATVPYKQSFAYKKYRAGFSYASKFNLLYGGLVSAVLLALSLSVSVFLLARNYGYYSYGYNAYSTSGDPMTLIWSILSAPPGDNPLLGGGLAGFLGGIIFWPAAAYTAAKRSNILFGLIVFGLLGFVIGQTNIGLGIDLYSSTAASYVTGAYLVTVGILWLINDTVCRRLLHK